MIVRFGQAPFERLASMERDDTRDLTGHRDLSANIPSIHSGAVLGASKLVGLTVRPVDLKLQIHVVDGDRVRLDANGFHRS